MKLENIICLNTVLRILLRMNFFMQLSAWMKTQQEQGTQQNNRHHKHFLAMRGSLV